MRDDDRQWVALQGELTERTNQLQQAQEKLTLLASKITELEATLTEYGEQAHQGMFVNHECPAMFACAYIYADAESKGFDQ